MPDEDKKPEPKKPAVAFDSEDDFLRAVGERSDKKVRAAEKAAAAKARAELLATLGVESEEEIEQLKGLKETSGKAKSEAEQLQAQAKKLAKDLADTRKERDELVTFRTRTVKESALREHAGKFRDYDDLVAHVMDKVPFNDDGSVDAKALGKAVDELLAKKPHLAKPEHKPGGGTSHRDTTSGTAGNGTSKPKSPVAAFADAMAAAHSEALNNRS